MVSLKVYRDLVENLNDVIFTTDTTGILTYVSPAAERVLGCSPSDGVGKHYSLLFQGEDLPTATSNFGKVLRNVLGANEYRIRRVAGDYVWVRISSRPIIEDGRVVGTLGILSDITERKRAEEELSKYRDHLEELVQERTADLERVNQELTLAKEQAEAADRSKCAFLANMSHELRTPLNAILGYAQLLRLQSNLTPVQAQYIETIGRSGGRLLALINDVLEMAKIEAERVFLNPATFDLAALLKELGDSFQPQAEEKGLHFRVDQVAPGIRYLRADEGKLRQILLSLLSNAVKFTQEGQVQVRALPIKEEGESVRVAIEVEDTGCGVAPEELNQIFNPFEQAESGRRSGTGAGLSMAISRRYARLMDGELSVVSGDRKEIVFRLEFPAVIGAEQDVVKRVSSRQASEAALRRETSPVARKLPAEWIEGLPPGWLDAAGEAIETADLDRLTDLLGQIAEQRPELARALRDRVECYDYTSLSKLFGKA